MTGEPWPTHVEITYHDSDGVEHRLAGVRIAPGVDSPDLRLLRHLERLTAGAIRVRAHVRGDDLAAYLGQRRNPLVDWIGDVFTAALRASLESGRKDGTGDPVWVAQGGAEVCGRDVLGFRCTRPPGHDGACVSTGTTVIPRGDE